MAKKTGEKRNSKKRDSNPMDFETSLQQLELIVTHLEDGNLGLSESLVQYEQGVKHLKHCYDLLQQTEQRIEILSGIDSEGRPITKPFEASDAAEEVLVIERGDFPGAKNLFGGILYSGVLAELIPEFWESAPIERKPLRAIESRPMKNIRNA